MPLVLAIEPDRRQAAHIARLVRERLHAQLVLVDSTAHAIAALDHRALPDLVLVPALLSPKDDASLADALRAAADTSPIRVLITPLLSSTTSPSRKGLMGRLRRGRNTTGSSEGCDPTVFAEQIAAYLAETGALPDTEEREPAVVSAPTPLEAVRAMEPRADTLQVDDAWEDLAMAIVASHDTHADEHPALVTAAAPDGEWDEMVRSLRAAVGELRFEEWFAGVPTTGDGCNEWGLYDPERCGIAVLERYVDSLRTADDDPPHRSR